MRETKDELRVIGKLMLIFCMIAAAPLLAPILGCIYLAIYIFDLWDRTD